MIIFLLILLLTIGVVNIVILAKHNKIDEDTIKEFYMENDSIEWRLGDIESDIKEIKKMVKFNTQIKEALYREWH